MTEYGVMVQTIDIKPGMADATATKVSQNFTAGLNQIVQKASKGLATPQGKGWKILSHSLTRVDRYLILSLLISR